MFVAHMYQVWLWGIKAEVGKFYWGLQNGKNRPIRILKSTS
jgi:hypothetical protein